jgi:hypothetical protein
LLLAKLAIIRNIPPIITDFYKNVFFYYFIFRSDKQILRRQVKIDIEISDFFEINAFKSESKDNDNIGLNLNYQKILMGGELEQEIVGICKNGGIN